jgi:hypothetical protein
LAFEDEGNTVRRIIYAKFQSPIPVPKRTTSCELVARVFDTVAEELEDLARCLEVAEGLRVEPRLAASDV